MVLDWHPEARRLLLASAVASLTMPQAASCLCTRQGFSSMLGITRALAACRAAGLTRRQVSPLRPTLACECLVRCESYADAACAER